jgi:hypothetical protein
LVQVVAEHNGVTEGGWATGGRDVEEVEFDLSGGVGQTVMLSVLAEANEA